MLRRAGCTLARRLASAARSPRPSVGLVYHRAHHHQHRRRARAAWSTSTLRRLGRPASAPLAGLRRHQAACSPERARRPCSRPLAKPLDRDPRRSPRCMALALFGVGLTRSSIDDGGVFVCFLALHRRPSSRVALDRGRDRPGCPGVTAAAPQGADPGRLRGGLRSSRSPRTAPTRTCRSPTQVIIFAGDGHGPEHRRRPRRPARPRLHRLPRRRRLHGGDPVRLGVLDGRTCTRRSSSWS